MVFISINLNTLLNGTFQISSANVLISYLMISRNDEKLSDQKLIKQIVQGNEVAFAHLFDKYWKTLSNTAFKVLKDRDAAHDIVQEFFVEIWTKRGSLSVEHVSSYLHTAVKYKVINYIHKNKVPMDSLDFVDDFKSLNTTEEFLDLKELDELLKKSIAELPPQCSIVFRMSRFDYMSNKEIAEKLNLSVRTVENHIAQAIRILKPIIKNTVLTIVLCFLFFILEVK